MGMKEADVHPCLCPWWLLPKLVPWAGGEVEPVVSSQGATQGAPAGTEAASSSSQGTSVGKEGLVEPTVTQSDSENRDPSAHEEPETIPRRRGRPSHRFLGKKYRKYIGRR